MKIVQNSFGVLTSRRNEMIDITNQVETLVAKSGVKDGDAIIFCPHTTAAITINENADPDVTHDILLALEKVHALPCFGPERIYHCTLAVQSRDSV